MPKPRIIPENHLSAHHIGDWSIYQRPVAEGGSFLWMPFKVMLHPGAPAPWGNRYSFRLNWSPLEGRLAHSRDSLTLERQQPATYAQVELYLSLTFDRDWLDRHFTADEIAAEVARLAAARAGGKK